MTQEEINHMKQFATTYMINDITANIDSPENYIKYLDIAETTPNIIYIIKRCKTTKSTFDTLISGGAVAPSSQYILINKDNYEHTDDILNINQYIINKFLHNQNELIKVCQICTLEKEECFSLCINCGESICNKCSMEMYLENDNSDNKIKCPFCNTYGIDIGVYVKN